MARPTLEKHPQDLLFRSAETPFAASFAVKGSVVLVKSNDPDLLAVLPASDPTGDPPAFLWKLVRDDHCLTRPEPPLVLKTEEVSTVSFGPACVAACDRRRRELLCFVGAGVPAAEFREAMLPRFRELTEKALGR